MIVDPIGFSGPDINHDEIELVLSALRFGWGNNALAQIKRFENACSEFTGLKHGAALISDSAAMQLSILARGLKPGFEVLVPAVINTSLLAGLVHAGARVKYYDLEADTLLPDMDSLERVCTEDSRVVLALDSFGVLPPLATLQHFAEKIEAHLLVGLSQLPLVSEALEGVENFEGTVVVDLGGNQTPTCGQGSVVLSSNKQFIGRVIRLRTISANDTENGLVLVGFDYKMTPMMASLGEGQMRHYAELLEKNKAIHALYDKELAECPVRIVSSEGATPVLHLKDVNRNDFMAFLRRYNIFTFTPGNELLGYVFLGDDTFPGARDAFNKCLFLPAGQTRAEEEIVFVCNVIKAFFADASNPSVALPGWMQYKSDLLHLLTQLKHQGGTIPFVHDGVDCHLRVMTVEDCQRDEVIAFEQALQNANMHVFFKRTTQTKEEARQQLLSYAQGSRDFIMFFICIDEKVYGHIGLNNFNFNEKSCAVDAFIMIDNAPRGLAAVASDALYAWAQHSLGMKYLYCDMAGSNKKVRMLCASKGWKEINRTALRRHAIEGGEEFRPIYIMGHEEPDEYFVVSKVLLKYDPLEG